MPHSLRPPCPLGSPSLDAATACTSRSSEVAVQPTAAPSDALQGSRSGPILTLDALGDVLDHARREYPRECCGVVYGSRRDRLATRVRRGRNIQDHLHAEAPATYPRDSHTAFHLDVADLLALVEALDGDEPPLIVYHSHCDLPAYLSQADRAAAELAGAPTYPVDHVVVSLDRAGPRELVQFGWSDDRKAYVETRRYQVATAPTTGR